MAKILIPRRMMYFIDGENLVLRYQAMKAKGYIPYSTVIHQQDEYLWAQNIWTPGDHRIVRAYYYSSVSGDDDKIQAVTQRVKQFPIRSNVPDGSAKTLNPCIFKKPKKSMKAKGVDIQMTVDILTHIYQDNLDTLCLFSGDGDYRPILNEAIRNGKHVYVAAFSEGLNPIMRQLADEMIELDPVFFEPNKQTNPA